MLINLDGNIVNRFGDRFPVPFMEKINVNNTHIDIDLSFYFMKDNADEGDVLWNEYVSSLSDLQYSIVMVPDFIAGGNGYDPFGLSQENLLKKYGPIQYNQTGTGLFSRIKTGELNILDIVVSNDQRTYEGTDFISTYAREQYVYYAEGQGFYKLNESNVLFVNQLNLLDTTDTWTTETHYDASNNEIVKFIKTIRIENASGTAAVVYNHLGQIINAMKNGLKTHFVAFTTSLDNTVYPNNFTDDQIHDIREKNGPANILFAQISDLSYEQVSSNSQIKSSNVDVYKTPSGQIYDSDVMQSIEGTYYGSSTVSNEDIINSFSDLVTATNDEQTQQKIDSLAYILAAHGNDINILRRLNDFRKTFLETSTATVVGRMHEKFEIRLYNANNGVKRGTPLTRTLNLSPVVIDSTDTADLTGGTAISYSEFFEPEYSNNFIYTRNAKIGAYALPSGGEITREAIEAAYDTFATLREEAKDNRDEYLSQAKSNYKQVLVYLAEAILKAFNEIIHYSTVEGEGDINPDNVTKIEIKDPTIDASGDFVHNLNSGIVDSFDFSTNSGIKPSIFYNKITVLDKSRFTSRADYLPYFPVSGIDRGHCLVASIVELLLGPEVINVQLLRTIENKLEPLIFEGMDHSGKDPDHPDNVDANVLINGIYEFFMAHVIGADDQEGKVRSVDQLQAWNTTNVDLELEMFEIELKDHDLSTGPSSGAPGDYDAERLLKTYAGDNAEINVQYTLFPMIRKTQFSPEVYSQIASAITPTESALTFGFIDYSEAFFAAGPEYFKTDEFEVILAGLAAVAGTGGTMYRGTDVAEIPGVSKVFESKALINFENPDSVQKYTDALDYYYSLTKVATFADAAFLEPEGSSAYYRKQRFAGVSQMLEVLLAPFARMDVYINNGDRVEARFIDNGEAGKYYRDFIDDYKNYLQYQKQYFIYDKLKESFENIVTTMSETGVDSIFTDYNYYLNGYVFFDYEKAWHTTSNISKLLDTTKIESMLSKAFCHTFFNIKTARADKLFDETGTQRGETSVQIPNGSGGEYEPPTEDNYPDEITTRGYVESYFHSKAHIAAVPTTDSAILVQPSYIEDSNSEYGGTPMGRDSSLSEENIDTYGAIEQTSPSGTTVTSKEYPGLITRAFKLTGEGANNNYRLVCFEFQDVDGSYSAIPEDFESGLLDPNENNNYTYIFAPNGVRNSLLFKVTVSDRTVDIINILAKQYYSAVFTDFEFYYQAALEECSFNSSTDKLNDFFVNSINEQYVDDPHLAPWFKTAFVYNFHLDLLTNRYGGDIELIKVAAINDTQTIYPHNTTLSELEAYRNKIRNLYEDSTNGYTKLLADAALLTNKEIVFGGHPVTNGIESAADHAAIVVEIPLPANIDPYAYAPAEGGGFIIRPETVTDIIS